MKNKRCLIAMSGGVDSSVTAALMMEAGYDCAGITMKLFSREAPGFLSSSMPKSLPDSEQQSPHPPPSHPQSSLQQSSLQPSSQSPQQSLHTQSPLQQVPEQQAVESVCTGDDARDAEQVCKQLGIPHYTLDLTSEFQQRVIHPFVENYITGSTPNPCIYCNKHLKFSALLAWAKQEGFSCLATGHYARIREGRLLKAFDTTKDQSYVLYTLSRDQLDVLRFPLGEYSKEEVRKLAEARGFKNARKPESQDICFVPDGRYVHFIEEYLSKQNPWQSSDAEPDKHLGQSAVAEPEKHFGQSATAEPGKPLGQSSLEDSGELYERSAQKSSTGVPLALPKPGNIVTLDGTIVGSHNGIHHYTIGQRRGLGIPGPEPYYVVDIEAATATITVGTSEERGRNTALISGVNQLYPGAFVDGQSVTVKHRYRGREHHARVFIQNDNSSKIVFDQKQPDLTKGQALVMYDDDCVLGGGIIVATE